MHKKLFFQWKLKGAVSNWERTVCFFLKKCYTRLNKFLNLKYWSIYAQWHCFTRLNFKMIKFSNSTFQSLHLFPTKLLLENIFTYLISGFELGNMFKSHKLEMLGQKFFHSIIAYIQSRHIHPSTFTQLC